MASMPRRSDQGFVSLRDAMNQLLSDSFAPFSGQVVGAPQGAGDNLPVNAYEDGEQFYVHLLAPGIDPESAEITAANGVLSITTRQLPLAQEGWRPVWQEFAPTEYRRQLRLPVEFDPNKIEATYQNGVLMITVPKAEHTRPKQIKVQLGQK
jgi:HSP20 family protein